MSGEFVDTNILVYAHDFSAGAKREVAVELLLRLMAEGSGCLSVQVLMEFFVTVTRKIPKPLSVDQAEEILADFGTWKTFAPQAADVRLAIQLMKNQPLSFWDAMIIQAAAAMDASMIWPEDLQNGQVYAGVTVRNPF